MKPRFAELAFTVALAVTSAAAAAAAAVPTCTAITNSSIEVSFEPGEGTDLHYVQLSGADASRPFALVTTRDFPVVVSGLTAAMAYNVSVRSHNASTPSIAYGPSWFAPFGTVECSTAATAAAASATSEIGGGKRGGGESQFLRVYRVSEYSFSVDFLANHDAASVEAMPLYLMTCDPSGDCAPWSVADLTDRWASCQAALASEAVCGAEPVGRGAGFACMDCMEAHRSAVTEACGEWTSEDSLSGEGSFAVHWYCGVGWPESTAEEGPITEYCVEFSPLGNSSSINAASSSSSDNDDDDALPDDYFSGYLSCNSDEVDGVYGSAQTPRDPLCVCICYDDRLLAHQPLHQLQADCDLAPGDARLPWVDEVNCNCPGTDSPIPAAANTSSSQEGQGAGGAAGGGGAGAEAGAGAGTVLVGAGGGGGGGGNPSLRNVGRAPVFIPYVGVTLRPRAARPPWLEPWGHNYHFPKGGACAEGASLGDGGCTWRRLPGARMIYGEDLVEAGWSKAFVPDTPSDTNHTKANVRAFQTALDHLGRLVRPAAECGGE